MPVQPSSRDLSRIYRGTERIAAVGASANHAKAGRPDPALPAEAGLPFLPVTPRRGRLSAARLLITQRGRCASRCGGRVDAAGRGGGQRPAGVGAAAKVLWIQPGTAPAGAAHLASEAGLTIVWVPA